MLGQEDEFSSNHYGDSRPADLSISTNLFVLNRQVSQEVLDVLYQENIFRFILMHVPARIQGCSLRIHAYEAHSGRVFPMLPPPVASKIKNMNLHIFGNLQDRRKFRDIRNWLSEVASNLTKVGNQLEQLKITLVHSTYGSRGYAFRRTAGQRAAADKVQPIQGGAYVLESLAELRGLKNVTIEGDFCDSFPSILAHVMSQNSSSQVSLPLIEYEDKIIFKRPYGKKKKSKLALLGRKWFEPIYDWNAVRQGLEEDSR
ncbi:hypothetical protein EJ08DRAFT_306818 [Tothia fuscella]|uniref:Uncharacterized protein n=1 Tax=Tothia fuscella TaxID=1048955 RepID=A0A9P4TX17_9PEZI|nr:hypothetical protein EJ08DRAFT_306818 [Tothia fuscella]